MELGQKLFSKTATNDLLTGSNVVSSKMTMLVQDGAIGNGGGIIVTNLLDSQTSSPTMKKDLAEQLAPITSSRIANSTDPNNRASKQSASHVQRQVLASSGPGQQSYHLKSQSSSNANYMSNFQTAAGKAVEQLANSQGRAQAETWNKKAGQGLQEALQGFHPLDIQTGTKSAVLNANQNQHDKREIRKIPSKKNVTSKKKKVIRQDQQYLGEQLTTETDMSLHQKFSASSGKHKPRNSSHTNRFGIPTTYAEILQGSSNATTNMQNTPIMTGTHQAIYQPPPIPAGDQYQGFSFITPIQQTPFSFQGMQPGPHPQHQQVMGPQPHMGFAIQQQPQVHFIAKQQKFYGISPERTPLVFKQSGQEKRPYTSSGHVLGKRVSKNSQHINNTNAIAALYLGASKTHNNGFGIQPRNQSQPIVDDNLYRHTNLLNQDPNQITANSVQQIPHKNFGSKKNNTIGTVQSNSAHVYRRDKNQVGSAAIGAYNVMGPNVKMPEQLQEEVIKLKQTANTHKEENIKLKTKIKILENEMGRKERMLEDFLQQNQFIQNAQKNGNSSTLAPIMQTAQRYQAETFLVMSLKKQVKEQKSELLKREEELAVAKRNIKNTKFFEMDQELKICKDELIRMRYLLEQAYQQNDNASETLPTSRPSATTTNGFQMALIQNNQSQPSIIGASSGIPSTAQYKVQSSSQSNFFPHTSGDVTCNMSNILAAGAASQVVGQMNHMTLSNDDQVSKASNDASECMQSNLPPLKGFISNGQQTPNQQPNIIMQPQLSTDQQQQSVLSQGATSLSVIESKDNNTEILRHLQMQISERDVLIRQLQQQLEESQARQRVTRGLAVEGKGGSAGPSVKSELQKVKKQLREKEKEILKLRGEQSAHASQKNILEEESDKKIKHLANQLTQVQKKAQEAKAEIKKRDMQNEKLAQDLSQASEALKQLNEKQKKESSQAQNTLNEEVEKLNKLAEDRANQNKNLVQELEKSRKQVQDLLEQQKNEHSIEEDETAVASKVPETAKSGQNKSNETDTNLSKEMGSPIAISNLLDGKVDGELGLIATVLGCRENRDRIEFAFDLKKFLEKEKDGREEVKEKKQIRPGLASDYKLTISKELQDLVKVTPAGELARMMPKYDFISASLAMAIMNELRRMLMEPELIDILNEKDQETRLPFDALRDLCSRFDKYLSDEQCAFITASYLTEIDEAIIFINFKEFLADCKDPRSARDQDLASSQHIVRSSLGSDESDSELKRLTRGRDNSPLSEMLNRSSGKGAIYRMRRSMDEEHMLDVAESIFIKIADLLNEKGRSARSVFSKFAETELFPDRTVLDLLPPSGFLQGIKEVGIEDLAEFEIACLMRVISKPELDSAIILNEFVMIMENFGVIDQEDDYDDYIPDSTEESINKSIEDETDKIASSADDTKPDEPSDAKEELKDSNNLDIQSKPSDRNQPLSKKKKKPRQHDLKNIDEKGVKILRKLARFLLKQFLHPREFFGKAIAKQCIKTKKREFYVDTLTFKEFYLRIKIANIRKRLTENESLNKEISLNYKTHKDLINVKLMVKALEEVAEDEQKILIEEEKEIAEIEQKERENRRELAANSDVETPRTESAEQLRDSASEEDLKKKDTSKKKEHQTKETYGVDHMIKFGNAAAKGKQAASMSPLLGERGIQQLNTIEEEKHETQTSNYMESASERENSKLLGSSNMRNSSNIVGFEFDEDAKPKSVTSKPRNSTSGIASPRTNDINTMNASVDLDNYGERNDYIGRLTGRNNPHKEKLTSKSLQQSDTEVNVISQSLNSNQIPIMKKELDLDRE